MSTSSLRGRVIFFFCEIPFQADDPVKRMNVSEDVFQARFLANCTRSFHTSRYTRYYGVRYSSCTWSRRYFIKRTRVTRGR